MTQAKKSKLAIRQAILNRVVRLEGQMRGIHRMIEEEKSCLDVITQISAARSAISMLGVEILKNDLLCKRAEKKNIDESYLKSLFKIS